MSDSEEIVVAKKGTPNNKKRKFNDTDLQSPQTKKSRAVLTPTVSSTQKNKKQKGQTPKQTPEVVKAKSKKRKHVDNGSDDDVETEDIKPQTKAGKAAAKKNKAKQNKGTDANSSEKTQVDTTKDAERKDDRDSRTLFVKNLPANCSVKHIKALSKDVKQVRIRTTFSVVDKKRLRILYAYVEFATEELAEKNLQILGDSYVKGNKLVVDYVGTKSTFITNKLKTEPEDVDELRLYVTGLPESTTENDLRALFPKATDIVLPKRKKDKRVFGYGFITFKSTDLAKQAHAIGQDLSLDGSKLVVLYAKKRKEQSDKDKRKKEKRAAKSAAKGNVKDEDKKNGGTPDAIEVDEDEEDDDDDDEEEEDDDEEEEEDDDEDDE